MNISEASNASGLSPDTIRFYERTGVVPAPSRLPNGYREYSERHVAALQFARRLKDIGIALPEIAAMVRLAHDGTCGDLRHAMLASIDVTQRNLDERLRALRKTRHELRGLRAGLSEMSPRRVSIPGITPCECVELVSRARGQQARP